MRKALAVVFGCALLAISTPSLTFAAARGQLGGTGSIAGTGTNNAGQVLAQTTMQLRNVVTNEVVNTTVTSASGGFTFTGLQAGQYAVEVLNSTGGIIGTSAAVTVSAGATITGVAVTVSGALVGGAGLGAGLAGAAGAGAAGGTSAAVIITSVASAAGLAGAAAVAGNASPIQ